MAQYALKQGSFDATTLPRQVGTLYQVGLSDGLRYFGYQFQNKGGQSKGLVEKNDVNDRSALTSYGSPNLVDRDLAYYPRVSQGDYSGGGLQQVFIDPKRYWDSDLDVSVPGAIQLRAKWLRTVNKASTTQTPGIWQIVAVQKYLYAVYDDTADQNFYQFTGGGAAVAKASGFPVSTGLSAIDSDGILIYILAGGAIKSYTSTGVFSANIATTTTGSAFNIWLVKQGTNGRFLYYQDGGLTNLYRIDLNGTLPSVGVTVPTGSDDSPIVDLVPYQNGVAFLTTEDATFNFQGTRADVWYFDGQNTTRIIHFDGFTGQGLCTSLGNLYVTLQSSNDFSYPLLAQITTGSFTVVAAAGAGRPTAATPQAGQPRSSGEYVYFPFLTPTVAGSVTTTPYIVAYNVQTGAVSHLQGFNADDFSAVASLLQGVRQMAPYGTTLSLVSVATIGGISQGFVQIQQSNSSIAASVLSYTASGWLVSSKLDFATPGIAKRFRRVQVYHAPLKAGEQVTVNAYVDTDPSTFTPTLAAVPTTATATNNVLGSVTTTLTMGVDTVGHTLFYAVQLTAGTSGLTTPTINYVAVEVGGAWTWEFDLDCSSLRRTLSQTGTDPQGVTGKDLYFLLRNAYENGTNLTLYLADGVSYTVAIESLEGSSIAYQDKPGNDGGPVKADEEWLVHVVIRQVT